MARKATRASAAPADEMVTTAGAARILGVVPDTVRKLAQAGRIAVAAEVEHGFYMLRLFRRSDIEALAQARKGRPRTGRPRAGAAS